MDTERGTCGRSRTAATIISNIFHPLMMPTYAASVILYGNTGFNFISNSAKLYMTTFIFLSTVLLPITVMPILKYLNLIGSYNLDTRKDRIIPLLIVAICYMLCMFFLSPEIGFIFARKVFLSAAVLLVLTVSVTAFWKISIHLAGLGGLSAIFLNITLANYGDLTRYLTATILIAGIVGSCRLYLGAHNLSQILTGFVAGFITMFLMTLL